MPSMPSQCGSRNVGTAMGTRRYWDRFRLFCIAVHPGACTIQQGHNKRIGPLNGHRKPQWGSLGVTGCAIIPVHVPAAEDAHASHGTAELLGILRSCRRNVRDCGTLTLSISAASPLLIHADEERFHRAWAVTIGDQFSCKKSYFLLFPLPTTKVLVTNRICSPSKRLKRLCCNIWSHIACCGLGMPRLCLRHLPCSWPMSSFLL